MRLVVSFPHNLSPAAVEHIRRMLDKAADDDEWRTLVLAEGGIVYDLDEPLTLVVGDGRVTVEQTPLEVTPV